MLDVQLDRFLSLAGQNMQDGPKFNSRVYQCIKEIDDHWLLLLFGNTRHNDSQAAGSLIINGHYFFRTSTSLIFSGQPTPIYSLLRTSLESCMYGAMITSKPELENIWLRRNLDDANKESCRREFTANKIFKFLEAKNLLLAKTCRQFYEVYIDYEAHPNINGTFTFIQPGSEDDPNAVVVNYLQGNGRETRIAAFSAVQLAEAALHLSLLAMPNRTTEYGTKRFLDEFSPKISHQLFGI